jgi:heterotetrameric sarcosine oxidase gamma subunit
VAKIDLMPCSALQGLAIPGRYGAANGGPGVLLSEHAGLALAAVMVRKGAGEALTRRVHVVFGLDLPTTPRRSARGSLAFVWAGAGHWLAVTEGGDGSSFEKLLRDDLATLASISDESDGRAVLRIAGARARDALAKGVPVDLNPRVFTAGDAAVTTVGHIGVHLWQLDEAPTYEFAVFRSYAAAFWRWLIDSAAEFGVAVKGPIHGCEPTANACDQPRCTI